MDRSKLLQRRRPVMEALEALHSFRPISVWDPFEVLCPNTTCTAFDQTGKPLSRVEAEVSCYTGNPLTWW
jgi:hypothetical protein